MTPQENSPQENERTRAIVSDHPTPAWAARGRRLVVGQCRATCKCAVGSRTSAILPRAPPEKVFQGNSSQKISRPTPTTHPQRVPSGSTHAPKKPPKSRIWPTPYGGEGVCLRLIPLAQIPAGRRLTSTCLHFSQISSAAKAVPHAIWRAHVRSLTGG